MRSERQPMFGLVKAVLAVAFLVGGGAIAHAADCADDPKTTGLSRTVAIDSTGGKQFGRLQYPKTAPLRRMEVVLTFDDGPTVSTRNRSSTRSTGIA